MRNIVVGIVFATLTLLGLQASAQSDGPMRLLPDTLAEGADLVVSVTDGPIAATLAVRLTAGRTFLDLGSITLDRRGAGTASFPLPTEATAGDWTVSIRPVGAGSIDSDPLTITPAPVLVFDPGAAYPRQRVSFTAGEITPGIVELHVDNQIVYGPVAVSSTTVNADFELPAGPAGNLPAVLVTRTGQRITSVVTASVDRRARTINEPLLGALAASETITRDGTFGVTGELQVPEGTSVMDYQWTFYWRSGNNSPLPANVGPVEFDAATRNNRDGVPVGFSLDTVLPGLTTGFPQVEGLDKWGFGWINPETGESGKTERASPPIDDFEGIAITGRLVRPGGAPIQTAIWTVLPQTLLLDPDVLDDGQPGTKAATGGPQNSASIFAHENNEIAAAAKADLGLLLPGCQPSLANGVTDANGEFAFAFSPKQTAVLRAAQVAVDATAGGTVDVYPINEPPRDQFLIRLSALTQGFGIPVTGEPDLWGGLAYEFRRDSSSRYVFREGLDGPFGDDPFDPTQVLVSTMSPIPEGTELELNPGSMHMPEIVRGTSITVDGVNREQFGTLISFPSQAGTDLDDETVKFQLTWGFGPVDAVVSLGENNEVSAVLSTAEGGNTCGLASQTFTAELPGLATWPIPSNSDQITIPGQVVATTKLGQTFRGEFDVKIKRGPTWWQDEAYQEVRITWSPTSIFIAADEKPKSNDASVQDVPKDVGNLDNQNTENGATVTQSIKSGVLGGVKRESDDDQTVANQPSMKGTTRRTVAFTHREEREWTMPLELPLGREFDKAIDDDCPPGQPTVQCLRDRAGSLTEIDSRSILIIDTGKIPIFRYAWGVPPIAAATLGADIWFKAMLSYYIYLDFADFQVDLDSLVEPEVAGGLDIFFDLSVLGGLASAKVAASPGIGVGMPLVITNNLFNTQASVPCFQFILDLIVSLNLGPCPVCLSHEINERLIDFTRPGSCSVSLFGKSLLAKAAPTFPAGDKPGLATDGTGTTAAIYTTAAGMKAQMILAGQPTDLDDLDTGPGAMRPDAAFFDTGRAVAVWAQSSLDEMAFDALPDASYDDPTHCADGQQAEGCPMTQPQPIAGTEFQHLVYAVYENDAWGPTMDLTMPTTGEGGVALASCMPSDSSCPAQGEILAVWERDLAADIRQHDYALFYSIFDGATRTWSPVTAINRGSASADLQPSPLYVQGEPVVVFVREPANGSTLNLASRELWYEFLDSGAGPRKADNILPGVASPSAKGLSTNGFAVAYTRSTSLEFIGNRRALSLARASSCGSNGLCGWSSIEPRDQYQRRQFVEQPKLLVRPNDDLTVVGRRVGVDGNFEANETIGVVTSAGDLFKLDVKLSALGEGIAQSLTGDGAVNWLNQVAIDPVGGNLVVFNGQGLGVDEQPGAQFGQLGFKSSVVSRRIGSVTSKGVTGSGGLALHQQPTGPDLAIVNATSSADRLLPGSTVPVDLELINFGDDTGASVPVSAYWGGGPGVGTPAGTIQASGLDDGIVAMTMDVDVPATFGEDERRKLVVVVNAENAIAEGDATNNSRTLEIGGMPTPTNFQPAVDFAGTIAFLDWDELEDERVTGYRIYRRVLGESTINSVGFSTVNGFADVNVFRGVDYEYQVVSVSANLLESEPTAWVRVTVGPQTTDRLFDDSFESEPTLR